MRIFIAAALLCAAAVHSVSAQDDWPVRRRTRGNGVHIRIGRSYHLPSDQVVSRPVIVVGGSATIDGIVENDVVVLGGPVRIGPMAQIHADVMSVGGNVTVADGAQVTGEIQEVSVVWPGFRLALRDWFGYVDRGWWAALSLFGNLFRLALVMVAACFVALVAPHWVRRVEFRAGDAPIASGLIGVVTQVMFVPLLVMTVIALVITIVGIPLLVLLPFALLAFMIAWVAGFAGVAAQIGGGLRSRTASRATQSPVVDTAVGVFVLGLLTVIGNLLAMGPPGMTPLAAAFGGAGLVIEYLAWTVGLGAVLTAPFRNGWRAAPPPLPIQVSTHVPA